MTERGLKSEARSQSSLGWFGVKLFSAVSRNRRVERARGEEEFPNESASEILPPFTSLSHASPIQPVRASSFIQIELRARNWNSRGDQFSTRERENDLRLLPRACVPLPRVVILRFSPVEQVYLRGFDSSETNIEFPLSAVVFVQFVLHAEILTTRHCDTIISTVANRNIFESLYACNCNFLTKGTNLYCGNAVGIQFVVWINFHTLWNTLMCLRW